MKNEITIIGRLGADPVTGETEGGNKYTRFSVAVNRDYKTAEGEQITDWFTVTAWNRLAETTSEYLKKGRQVCVSGPLYISQVKSDKFVDAEGNSATMTYVGINADKVYFLDSANAKREEAPLVEPGKPSMKTIDTKGAGAKPPTASKPSKPSKKNDDSFMWQLPVPNSYFPWANRIRRRGSGATHCHLRHRHAFCLK